MNARDLMRLEQTDSDHILADLSARQHLTPHKSLGVALDESSNRLGFCPNAAQTAVGWLGLDTARALGRFTRTCEVECHTSVNLHTSDPTKLTRGSRGAVGRRYS